MTPVDPPVVATALLELLLPPRTSVGLVGDLIEERRNGRSWIWYWQQTMVALVTVAYREARARTPQAVGAVIIGYLCGASIFYVVTASAARFVGGYSAYLVFFPLGFFSAAISGWGLNRYSSQMVLVFAAFCVVGSVVAFGVYAVFALDRLPHLELMFFAALDFVVWPVGVLAGGIVGSARNRGQALRR